MMAETVSEISSTVSWVRVLFIARLIASEAHLQDKRIPERMTDSPAALIEDDPQKEKLEECETPDDSPVKASCYWESKHTD